jgi:mRNA interferase MazF
MATFKRGDVVRLPFPYTDRNTKQFRPALVVSRGGLGAKRSLLWVVMITSAANRGWPGDVALLHDYRKAGLPIPSLVRSTKIASVEASRADRIGRLGTDRWAEVESALRRHLGFETNR